MKWLHVVMVTHGVKVDIQDKWLHDKGHPWDEDMHYIMEI